MKPAIFLIITLFNVIVFTSCSKKESAIPDTSLVRLEEMRPPGPVDSVTIEIKRYCPAVGRSFKNLFIKNTMVKVQQGRLKFDSDGDGLTDEMEDANNLGFNVNKTKYDTNNDMFSDFLMILQGINTTQQLHLACTDQSDSDGDGIVWLDPATSTNKFIGLRNCEETRLTHTDPMKFDSDGDGIPDYFELRCGLNPLDPTDSQIDTDGDGVLNINECRKNTPIDENNNSNNIKTFEYNYSMQADLQNSGCFNFTVSNIPILNGGNGNLLMFNFIENDSSTTPHLWTNFMVLPANSNGLKFVIENFSGIGGFTPR